MLAPSECEKSAPDVAPDPTSKLLLEESATATPRHHVVCSHMLSRASHQVTNRLRIGVCSGEVWVERPAGDDGFEGGQQRHALFSKGGKVASEARERICAPLGAE